jgi:hypothetical protein
LAGTCLANIAARQEMHMNAPQPNPFIGWSWDALLEKMSEWRATGKDEGPMWDLLVEEVNKHTGETPYP